MTSPQESLKIWYQVESMKRCIRKDKRWSKSHIMNFLAIDYWTSKSWLAVNVEKIALPLKVVDTKNLIDIVKSIVQERKIDKIVLWLPYHVDWRESHLSRKVKAFKWVLRASLPTNISIIFHDERFSSFEAKSSMEATEAKKIDKWRLDDMAASIILQSYLDSNI